MLPAFTALATDPAANQNPLGSLMLDELWQVAGPQGAGLSSQDIRLTGALAIKVVLYFLGFIFLILIIYAGLMWMLSAGNEEKITKAKGILVSSIIGLVIILLSYSIVIFIFDKVYNYVANPPGADNRSWTF